MYYVPGTRTMVLTMFDWPESKRAGWRLVKTFPSPKQQASMPVCQYTNTKTSSFSSHRQNISENLHHAIFKSSNCSEQSRGTSR